MMFAMFLFTLIVCFFTFLFCLYKFTKDDYQFIRKNISSEQVFDIVFIVFWIGLFFARFIFFIGYNLQERDLLSSFFSLRFGGFSLPGGIFGGSLMLFLIGKYRKIPIGRMFDFFSLALLFSLPIGFTGYAFSLRSNASYLYLAVGLLYLILLILFMRFLFPRILNRTIREGNLSLYFIAIYSLLSLFASVLRLEKNVVAFISIDTLLLIVFLLLSLFIVVKQESSRLKGRGAIKK